MSQNNPEGVELAKELQELMRQLKEAVRVAREHPQTREFEHQIAKAVADLTAQIDRSIKKAQEDERLQKIGAQVKETAESFKASRAREEIEQGLARGVHGLNDQIRRAVQEAEKSPRETKSPEAESAPVEGEFRVIEPKPPEAGTPQG